MKNIFYNQNLRLFPLGCDDFIGLIYHAKKTIGYKSRNTQLPNYVVSNILLAFLDFF